MDFNGHIVPLGDLSADYAASSPTSRYCHMENYNHVSIILFENSSTSARTVTVKEASASTGTGAAAIAFRYRQTTADTDTWADWATATTTGASVTASTGHKIVQIDVDSENLSDGKDWVAVTVAEATAHGTVTGAKLAIFTEPRYGAQTNISVLS